MSKYKESYNRKKYMEIETLELTTENILQKDKILYILIIILFIKLYNSIILLDTNCVSKLYPTLKFIAVRTPVEDNIL